MIVWYKAYLSRRLYTLSQCMVSVNKMFDEDDPGMLYSIVVELYLAEFQSYMHVMHTYILLVC